MSCTFPCTRAVGSFDPLRLPQLFPIIGEFHWHSPMTITLCNVEQAVGTSLVPRPPRPALVACSTKSVLLVLLFELQVTKAGREGLGTRLQWDSTV